MKFARLHFGKAAQQFLLVPHRDGGERALNAETFHTATRRMEGRRDRQSDSRHPKIRAKQMRSEQMAMRLSKSNEEHSEICKRRKRS